MAAPGSAGGHASLSNTIAAPSGLRPNPRQLHRWLVPIAAVPLLFTATTGALAGVLEARGVEAEWLLLWHSGHLGPVDLSPHYSLVLGLLTLLLIGSGLPLLLRGRRRSAGAPSTGDKE